MPLISVTRLRIRAVRFLPAFYWSAIRSYRQAKKASGNLGVQLLNEPGRVFWTCTAWDNEDSMRTYITTGAHKPLLRKLMHWCDEAAVTHWEQDTGELPTWTEAHRRLITSGRASKVLYPSPAHAALRYPAPRQRAAST